MLYHYIDRSGKKKKTDTRQFFFDKNNKMKRSNKCLYANDGK